MTLVYSLPSEPGQLALQTCAIESFDLHWPSAVQLNGVPIGDHNNEMTLHRKCSLVQDVWA